MTITQGIGDLPLVADSVGEGLLMLWQSNRGSHLRHLPVGSAEVSSKCTGLGTFAPVRSEVDLLWAPPHM
jgi:hypothetical protein